MFAWGGGDMRHAAVFIGLLLGSMAVLHGQSPTIDKGQPALEFTSEEGTARIVRVVNSKGYPVLVFSVAHFHVIGQCFGSLNVSAGSVEFVGSGGHWAGVSLLGKPFETLSWSKDKKGRDCLVLRREGQVDRLAFAVTGAKGKLSAPVVLTGELAKLRTWFDDAIADFEETAYRFRKLTERTP
jgi:hypothetical protein